jgi:ribosomal protein S18 acetylase RimI-like enzyme
MKKKIYILEIDSSMPLNRRTPNDEVQVIRSSLINPLINSFFYKEIGSIHGWCDRASFSYEDWEAYLTERSILTRLVMYRGTLAGYFELAPHEDGSYEIALLGVLSNFIGLGIGSQALTEAISEGLLLSSNDKVWVSTCSLDHPAALQTYQRAGMRIVSVTEEAL